MKIGSIIYKTIQRMCVAIGFNLAVAKIHKVSTEGYEHIYPLASYAPWLSDEPFKRVHNSIKDYTMVSTYRLYELWQLVAETKGLSGALIEVGAWKGGSGALIAAQAEFNGIKDKVYVCDTFEGVVKASEHDGFYKGGEHSDASELDVKAIIKKLQLNNVEILVGVFPNETKHLIENNKFRFCHVDVDVYESAKDIVEWIWDKLVVGGIIVFDDYAFEGCNGITKYVNEQRGKYDRVVIHNLNGHGIIVKVK